MSTAARDKPEPHAYNWRYVPACDALGVLRPGFRLPGGIDARGALPTVQGASSHAEVSGTPSTLLVGFFETADSASKLWARARPATPSTEVDAFLSHSWADPWLGKHVAVAFVLNHALAVGVACAVWAVLFAVRLYHVQARDAPSHFGASMAVLMGCPGAAYLGALFLGQHLLPRGLRARVFLDRLCIHQHHAELKREGIKTLGKVLAASRSLVVLASSDYFDRLWCVYELGVYEKERGTSGRLVVVPLWVPPFTFALFAAEGLGTVVAASLQEHAALLLNALGPAVGTALFITVVQALPSAIYCSMVRTQLRLRAVAARKLAAFRLDATQVTVEADRPLVYREMRQRFGTLGAFEAFVSGDVRDAADAAIGVSRPPYVRLLFGALPLLWYAAVDTVSASDANVAAQGFASRACYAAGNLYFYGCLTVVAVPASLATLQSMAIATDSAGLAARWLAPCGGSLCAVFLLSCAAFVTAAVLIHACDTRRGSE